MAKLGYELNQSLDGYVDHTKLGPPAPAVSRHFIELVRGLTGLIYGRRTYEIMRYWDEDLPDWDAEDHEFAAAWRSKPIWVVSRTLKSVGPNATLVEGDIEGLAQSVDKFCHGTKSPLQVLENNLSRRSAEVRLDTICARHCQCNQ